MAQGHISLSEVEDGRDGVVVGQIWAGAGAWRGWEPAGVGEIRVHLRESEIRVHPRESEIRGQGEGRARWGLGACGHGRDPRASFGGWGVAGWRQAGAWQNSALCTPTLRP
jgi:hypothetical protein